MRYMHHRANNLLLCGKSSDADIQEEHKRLGMRPAGLTLEITEGAAIADPAYIAELPRRLPDVRLSIADFGVGHSSLVNLGRLPFAEVKIDRSFVTGCEASREDLADYSSVVDLACWACGRLPKALRQPNSSGSSAPRLRSRPRFPFRQIDAGRGRPRLVRGVESSAEA